MFAIIHHWAIEHGLHNRDEGHTGPNDGMLTHDDLRELEHRLFDAVTAAEA